VVAMLGECSMLRSSLVGCVGGAVVLGITAVCIKFLVFVFLCCFACGVWRYDDSTVVQRDWHGPPARITFRIRESKLPAQL
jgi:hypothetical protein